MSLEMLLRRAPLPLHRSASGILYVEDFDAPDLPEPVEPEAVEPAFTLAELEDARAEARAAARLDAEEGQSAITARMLQAIAAGLDETRTAALEFASATAEIAARTMLSTLSSCLPELCARYGPNELKALARAVLPALVDEPRISIRLSPHDVPTIETELAALDPELSARIRLIPTDAVARGDIRIAWQDGSATRDAGVARAAVHDVLDALGLIDAKELAHA